MVSKEFKQLSKLLTQKMSEKGYNKQTAKVLCLLAVSTKAYDYFGNNIIALEHLLTLVEKYEEQDVLRLYTRTLNNKTGDGGVS